MEIIKNIIIALLFLIVILFTILAAIGHANELPKIYDNPRIYNEVKIQDLLKYSKVYDNKRVAVSGSILSVKIGIGRMGSKFFEYEIGTPESKIIVISNEQFLIENSRMLLVLGKYKEYGFSHGLIKENFIESTYIERY